MRDPHGDRERAVLDLLFLVIVVVVLVLGVLYLDRVQERHLVSKVGSAGVCYPPIVCTEREHWHHQCVYRA